MTIMNRLAVAIQTKGVDLSADLDLPTTLINIYACSVYRFETGASGLHVNIAAAHTAVAVAKLGNWCVENHNFRPHRSTAKTPVRRLRMADLIENPGAYNAALQLAKHNGESDVVAALRAIPGWISKTTGVPIPNLDEYAASSLWSALSSEISRLAPSREVRS